MRHSIACPFSLMSDCLNGSPRLPAATDHLLHDIDAGDELRHRVLDLHARVDLEHVEVLLVVHQELDRRGPRVPSVPDEAGRLLADLLACGGPGPALGSSMTF